MISVKPTYNIFSIHTALVARNFKSICSLLGSFKVFPSFQLFLQKPFKLQPHKMVKYTQTIRPQKPIV